MEKYDNAKVSVIIPMYNTEKYIEDTIKAVLQQSYKDIEIIVVDDCSTDASKQCVRKLSKDYSCIIYHLQERNAGVAVARNTGMRLATGRYIAFCDSDDLWKEDKLEKQLRLMKEKRVGFVFSAIEMISESGELIHGKRKIKQEVSYEYMLRNTVIPTSTVMLDRNTIEEFQMPVLKGEDYATWLMLLRDGKKAYGLDEALVQYRVRADSLSADKIKNVKNVWNIQIKQEKINEVFTMFNCCCYMWNAFLKYFIK